jgi:hypothetical protein
MLNVSGSISTNTGLAPTYDTASAVAMNVNGVDYFVARLYSGAISARWSASVPDATATACFTCGFATIFERLAVGPENKIPGDDSENRVGFVLDRFVLILDLPWNWHACRSLLTVILLSVSALSEIFDKTDHRQPTSVIDIRT